jgi:hypothetical protein
MCQAGKHMQRGSAAAALLLLIVASLVELVKVQAWWYHRGTRVGDKTPMCINF